MYGYFKTTTNNKPLIELEEEERKFTWEAYQKRKKEDTPEEDTTTEKITSGWEREYLCEPIKELLYILFKCKNCKKKLFSIRAWIAPNEDYWTKTHYYCKPCHRKRYGYPKKQEK
ncbi:hypothetical protein G9A89_012711 [Geosiphon pyriformis]|nr:hypothetical protein G9A89_012711 [Geosiphon pyriformis]